MKWATGLAALAVWATAGTALAAPDARAPEAWPQGSVVVSYSAEPALAAAIARHPATVVRRLPSLRVAVLKPRGEIGSYAALLAAEPGISRVERAAARRTYVEPALVRSSSGVAAQWQYAATRADRVPAAVAAAAANVTIAVIDTGADLQAPDIAAKAPHTFSVRTRTADVADLNGHGTFVAALAAGSGSNGNGIAGVAGGARLMVIQAGGPSGSFTDVEEAAAIVYAVDNGARIINLSLGGPTTSSVERRAIDYAVANGALLVAAVGNSFANGNAVEYPAALLQTPGSRGVGGRGLAVAASNRSGVRAAFSSTGTHLSLAAPGDGVFSAVSSTSPASRYPRVPLTGALGGLYGYGSGTSFAAPQVAGAAALVWAANPLLSAGEVASLIEQTASGHGSWTGELGYGVLDVAAAVALAKGPAILEPLTLRGSRTGSRIALSWPALSGATSFRVGVAQDGGVEQVLAGAATGTGASYSLAPGSDYTFTVAALDSAGTQLAVSAPWTVSLRVAKARLSLKASRPQGSRLVELDARLKIEGAPGVEGARNVILESFDGSRWSLATSAVTDASGRAVWRYAFAAGSYRIRARYAGTDEIASAVSTAVKLTVK